VSASTFDPFDLPSSFDPLQSGSPEPTGQSAYSRQAPPPHRRPVPASPGPLQSCHPPAIGAGNRLAHLLRPGNQPGCGKATPDPEDTATRLLTVEDDVAILTARLDSLHTAVTASLDDQREKLVKAVAALLDERLGPRR
jgi:hypothetical protein